MSTLVTTVKGNLQKTNLPVISSHRAMTQIVNSYTLYRMNFSVYVGHMTVFS